MIGTFSLMTVLLCVILLTLLTHYPWPGKWYSDDVMTWPFDEKSIDHSLIFFEIPIPINIIVPKFPTGRYYWYLYDMSMKIDELIW